MQFLCDVHISYKIQKFLDNEGYKTIHELPLQRVERRRMLLSKIIGRFKMITAKQINLMRKTTGNAFWQRNYFEHIIRNEAELNHIRKYIQQNVLKWELDRFHPKFVEM